MWNVQAQPPHLSNKPVLILAVGASEMLNPAGHRCSLKAGSVKVSAAAGGHDPVPVCEIRPHLLIADDTVGVRSGRKALHVLSQSMVGTEGLVLAHKLEHAAGRLAAPVVIHGATALATTFGRGASLGTKLALDGQPTFQFGLDVFQQETKQTFLILSTDKTN